nr:transposase [Massilia sp. YIM B02787]
MESAGIDGSKKASSRDFELEAIKLAENRGVSVSQAAQDRDVHENVLRKRVREHREQPEKAFPGNGKITAQDAEITRLRKEVAKLKMERDFLKNRSTRAETVAVSFLKA